MAVETEVKPSAASAAPKVKKPPLKLRGEHTGKVVLVLRVARATSLRPERLPIGHVLATVELGEGVTMGVLEGAISANDVLVRSNEEHDALTRSKR